MKLTINDIKVKTKKVKVELYDLVDDILNDDHHQDRYDFVLSNALSYVGLSVVKMTTNHYSYAKVVVYAGASEKQNEPIGTFTITKKLKRVIIDTVDKLVKDLMLDGIKNKS